MASPHILVVDDDPAIVYLISESLKEENYSVLTAFSGREALEIIAKSDISLLILDIMMPEMDGLEVCRTIRSRFAAPIILLSGKDRSLDKVIGLEIGADDYVTKPFHIGELVSRVKAHLRREERGKGERQPTPPAVINFKNLRINKDTFEVYRHSERIELSTKEFQILAYLAENRGRVLTREQIYGAIWGSEYGDISTVTVHIKNLRDKLDPGNRLIKTVWGMGYKFAVDEND
ncbi:response regulator transcription factor [Paenibacillus hamazuiensis]|uniref:response regulator transcription factor n=1 Tax=Paenibacillus hamazuiensis TaxID=2936508 RepID=UPI00200BEFB6|nr:response regulator transcription factor [Paenibacillus hamazuiensis]